MFFAIIIPQILFSIFQMQYKSSNIELGGPTFKAISPSKYLQKAYPTANSTQGLAIVSTHKIAGKVSPSKYRTNQTSRNASNFSENSCMEMNNSSFSTANCQPKPQSPLRDASNLAITSQQRQFVRVNFVNNSPNCSRTSSTHLREYHPSPSKMMGVESRGEREEALQRKMKVLQGRIGELHKEKHELAGKLNEENRKVYHENTALKIKITELTKKIEKQQSPIDRRAEAQAQTLRIEVRKLQQTINDLTEKNESLMQEYQQLSTDFSESKQHCLQFQQKNKELSEALQRKEDQYDSLHGQYLQLSEQKLEIAAMKDHYQQQLQQIQASFAETTQGNAAIVSEYESKLEEYRVAYDRNQEVIEQLSQQLQLAYSKSQPYPESDEVINRESEGELALECKNLESNFLQALQERDLQLQALENSNQQLCEQLQGKEHEVAELNAHLEAQAGRLEEVGAMLERYTVKMREMENRYEQLKQQHDIEIQRAKVEPSPVVQKCRKCDELTKTIFRLNAHLNKRT